MRPGARRVCRAAAGRARRTGLVCALGVLALVACGDDDVQRDAGPDAVGGDGSAGTAASPVRLDAAPPSAPDAGARIDGGDGDLDAALVSDAAAVSDAFIADAAAADAAVDEGRRERLSLVDQRAWEEVSEGDDPWDDPPEDASCAAEGFGFELFQEQDGYFVDTARCGYRTVTQATLTDVREGEEVVVRAWHFDLFGPTGAEAHMALRLGDHDLLDEHIPIPAESTLLRERFVAEGPIAAGTPITLHVHNHGANEYYLLEVSTGPAAE
jgi:hypothetical protein